MKNSIMILFCVGILLTQRTLAEESMAMYLGLSENEVLALQKHERIPIFRYTDKKYYEPSLIGDQSLWTKVEAEDIPIGSRKSVMEWINIVFNPKVIVHEKEIVITGWRYYFGYTIEPGGIKSPREAYEAGSSYITVRFENDDNKVLVYFAKIIRPTGIEPVFKIWVNLSERHSVENLSEEKLEMFSKNFIKTFFSIPDDSIEALQYRKNENEFTWLSCNLQTTFDMTTRPKVRYNDRDHPKAFVWCEQFMIQTNGQVICLSLPLRKTEQKSPAGMPFFSAFSIDQSSPAF